MVADDRGAPRGQGGASTVPRSVHPPRAIAALAPSPARDLGVVAGEQHVGHAPATVLGGSRVVGVLGRTAKAGAEGLLRARARFFERARQLAHDGVAEHHRGELAAGENVASDRDLVAAEVLENALVKALI